MFHVLRFYFIYNILQDFTRFHPIYINYKTVQDFTLSSLFTLFTTFYIINKTIFTLVYLHLVIQLRCLFLFRFHNIFNFNRLLFLLVQIRHSVICFSFVPGFPIFPEKSTNTLLNFHFNYVRYFISYFLK